MSEVGRREVERDVSPFWDINQSAWRRVMSSLKLRSPKMNVWSKRSDKSAKIHLQSSDTHLHEEKLAYLQP